MQPGTSTYLMMRMRYSGVQICEGNAMCLACHATSGRDSGYPVNMKKRALIIGIDHYPTAPLKGCITDASNMADLLAENGDGTANFECRTLLSSAEIITRDKMEENISKLFASPADAAVFYFSGHGTQNLLGGYLVSQDAKKASHGYSFHDLLRSANLSPVKEITIILDCCYSGAMGENDDLEGNVAQLREGISILSACRQNESAIEKQTGGIFTSIIVNALLGEAADLTGNVTISGIYYQTDTLLSSWDQRPLFKAYLSQMAVLRRVKPRVKMNTLKRLNEFFPSPDSSFALDKSFEPTEEGHDETKAAIFATLQKFRAVNLVEPCTYDHLYYEALNMGSCRLTQLGKYYWRMIDKSGV